MSASANVNVTLQRHPWRLELVGGTVIYDSGRAADAPPDLWARPDINVFSFCTPAGEIGINHETGVFFALGHILQHPDYRVAAWRHWHRVGRAADIGQTKTTAANPLVTGYSVGMELQRPDESKQILHLWFPPDVSMLHEVRVRTRYVYTGDGRVDQDIEVPLSLWVMGRALRGKVN